MTANDDKNAPKTWSSKYYYIVLAFCLSTKYYATILNYIKPCITSNNNIQIDMNVNTNVTNTFPKAVQFNQYFVSLYNCFIVNSMRCFFSD